MAVKMICDADGKTPIRPGEEVQYGFGILRVYSKEAEPYVDEYVKALKEAAGEARKLFVQARENAAKKFYTQFPDGKLPDVPDSEYADE